MKTALTCVFALAAYAAAAPALTQGEIPPQGVVYHPVLVRPKRSSYSPQYISPCAAASALPALGPAPYQLNLAPVHHGGYAAPHSYGYGYAVPQYRSEMGDEEMMGFSDMDGMSDHAMARYAYAPSAGHFGVGVGSSSSSVALGQSESSSSSGPVYGVFPNANPGGGSVALLLSCTPNVSSGKILKNHQSSASSSIASEAYRGVDEHGHHDTHEHQGQEQDMTSSHDSHASIHQ